MALSKRQYASNKKYNDKTYEQLGFRSRKDERLDEMIALGAKKTNQTKSMYMKNAIISQLKSDGIVSDQLPNISIHLQPEPKQPKFHMIYMITEFYKQAERHQEKLITTFPTMSMARKYVEGKLEKKPYPEDWIYIIRGRNIEGNRKQDALVKLRNVIQDILEAHEHDEQSSDGRVFTSKCFDDLNEYSPLVCSAYMSYDENGISFIEYTAEEEAEVEFDFSEIESVDENGIETVDDG